MVTNKHKKNFFDVLKKAGLLGISLAIPKTEVHAEASGESGGGDTGLSDDAVAMINQAVGSYSVPGTYDVFSNGDYVGTVDITDISEPQSSTPFLSVWNGQKYVHENDFLFGKPQTAFANYNLGIKAYQQGIGGDTYLLSDALCADENGELKMQIKELEPEESYIDKFAMGALDLKENEHFVADGNLEDSYIFDTTEANIIAGGMQHYHSKQNVFTTAKSTYETLKPQKGQSITLETGDVLVLQVPKAQLSSERDTFILVDSHFRDWTLGDQVPFSRLENFVIQSTALGKSSATALAGLAMLASIAFIGTDKSESGPLAKLLTVPYTYADYVVGKSLIVTAGSMTDQIHLQTLFPRYVQAAQEVIRIPKDIIANLQEEFLTLRIRATKKHKVLAAFIFQGTPHTPEIKTLSVQKVVNTKTGADYTEQIKEKNSTFLHTLPGDVLNVVVKDSPKVANTTRRYVLRANGFYTRMTAKTAAMIGKNWLDRLAPEDRSLLKDLRLS